VGEYKMECEIMAIEQLTKKLEESRQALTKIQKLIEKNNEGDNRGWMSQEDTILRIVKKALK
jgi:hypothetical protein